jgi:hypothetical protein
VPRKTRPSRQLTQPIEKTNQPEMSANVSEWWERTAAPRLVGEAGGEHGRSRKEGKEGKRV